MYYIFPLFRIGLSSRNENLTVIFKKNLSKSDIFAVHEIRSYIYIYIYIYVCVCVCVCVCMCVCVCVCAFISNVLRYDEYLVKHNDIVHKIMSDSK